MAVQQETRARQRLDLGAAFMQYDVNQSVFIGTSVLALLPTTQKEATFSVITRESILKRADAKRASGGNYNRIDMYSEDDDYRAEERGLESRLPDDQKTFFASDFDAELQTVQHCWHKLMNELELVISPQVFNETTWTGSALATDNSGDPWDSTTADIIGQILKAKEKVRVNTGMMPNSLIVSAVQMTNMLLSDDIQAQFPGAPLITLAMLEGALPSIFGLQRIIVGGQVYDSAIEQQDFVSADVWSDDFAMVALLATEGANINAPCIGRTFIWTPDSPDLRTVEQYREEQTRSDVFRCRHHVVSKIFDPFFGHLLKVDA